MEEAVRLLFTLCFGPAAAGLTIGVGVAEGLIAGSWVPFAAHLGLGALAWYAPPLALALHIAWNATALGPRADYRLAGPDEPRRCSVGVYPQKGDGLELPVPRRPLPTVVDPTVTFRLRLGTKTVIDIQPSEKWTTYKVGEYLGQSIYQLRKEVLTPPVDISRVGDLVALLPCNSRTPLGAVRLGSCCGVRPTVDMNCVHNAVWSFFLRRGPERPKYDEDAFAEFQRLLIAFCHPFRLALRAAPFVSWTMDERFEWWVSRPGKFTATAQQRFRLAWHEVQVFGLRVEEAGRCSHFGKNELSSKPMPKPRGITALSERMAVVRGPTTQLVAEVVGKMMLPGVYPTLPGVKLPFDFFWAKGSNAEVLGESIQTVLQQSGISIGTDACEYDKCHLGPVLTATDLTTALMPLEWASWLRKAKYQSRVVYNTIDGIYKINYSYYGGILTGEPNVSLTNTKIRSVLDLFTQAAVCRPTPC
jgi:hypothetical protein